MNSIYILKIKETKIYERSRSFHQFTNQPTHPRYYLLSDIWLRLSDPSILPNIRTPFPTGFFVARRGHREAMEFYFSAAYYVSIMYRLLFRCASIFSARSFERRRPATHEERTVRRPCDSFSISVLGSWGNLTSGKRVNARLYYAFRHRTMVIKRFRWNGERSLFILLVHVWRTTCDDVRWCKKMFNFSSVSYGERSPFEIIYFGRISYLC